MLEKIHLRNFKSHRDTELSLDGSRLHALVGQNSSGKTSVLQALHYFRKIIDLKLHENFPRQILEFIVSVGEEECSVFVNGLQKGDSPIDWQASHKFRFIKNSSIWQSILSWGSAGNEAEVIVSEGWPFSFHDKGKPFPQTLGFAVYLKLAASNLAKAAYSDAIIPQMKSDGSEFAPALDYLRNESPDNFQILQDMLRRIVPTVRKIGIRRAKVMVSRQRLIEADGRSIAYEENQEITGQEVVLDMTTGERIPAHAISEGTLLSLGLLTVLMSPQKPSLLLLDDIEQGLHPKAQRELVTVFKEIIAANQNLQIIFSTHSPYIVDELAPSQVHVLSNANSGFTRCKRLDEHPDAEWAKHTLTTGEFWDAEGEDWVGDGETDA